MPPIVKKPQTSNPHSVSKEYANALHNLIKQWYPNKAGKLTGMFLQNHDQDKVIKYLGRTERLHQKIDKFAKLLDLNKGVNPTNNATNQ